MRTVIAFAALALFACPSSAGTSGTPSKVSRAAKKLFGTRKVEIEREGAVYEAESTTSIDAVLSKSGVLLETKVHVPVASLPTAITAAVADIEEAELVIAGDDVFFEVEAAGRVYRLDVAGTVTSDDADDDTAGEDEDDR